MLTAYFDCPAGASGDMILAALLDAGAPLDRLTEELAKLGLPGYRLSAEKVVKQGFAATRFEVRSTDGDGPIDHTEDDGHGHSHSCVDEQASSGAAAHAAHAHPHPHDTQHGTGPRHAHGQTRHAHAHLGPHRHLADVTAIIQAAALSEPVRRRAVAVFTRLAEAEAKAHGLPVEKVHFHEVGAVDAIVDVVGACVAIELLGVGRIVVSPLPPGSGTVRCAHGPVPVPAPATLELLKGVPLAANRNAGEALTPTGAAILTTLADEYADGPPPGSRIRAVGVGAGRREGTALPNLLRVMLTEPAQPAGETADVVTLFETNLDDLDAQAIGHCFGRLLDAGALDVWATPIVMKKNRPAYMLSVLCPADSPAEAACRDILFRQTSTFGLRQQRLSRSKLAREQVVVETEHGPIRVKIGRLEGSVVQAQPEYEDCRAAAERTGRSLVEVRQAAQAAYRRQAP